MTTKILTTTCTKHYKHVLYLCCYCCCCAAVCFKDFPVLESEYFEIPPYWQAKHCPIEVFTMSEIRKCLYKRTVYVMGNSVARQGAFNLLEMLGGIAEDREKQKVLCPKVSASWEDEKGCVKAPLFFI